MMISSTRSSSLQVIAINSHHHAWITWTAFMLTFFGQSVIVAGQIPPHEQLCFRSFKEDKDALPKSIGGQYTYDTLDTTFIKEAKYAGDDPNYVQQCSEQKTGDPAGRAKFCTYRIDVNPIMYNGEYLFGWFNLKIRDRRDGDTHQALQHRIRWVMIQAQTTSGDFIPGEFIPAPFFDKTSCKTRHGQGEPRPVMKAFSKHQFVPCLYASDPSPTVPYVFGWSGYKQNEIPTPYELDLTWRITFPICGVFNNDTGLFFHVVIISGITSKDINSTFPVQGEIFFKQYVGGAYDPEPPKDPAVNCGMSLDEIQKQRLTLPEWISHIVPDDSRTPLPAAKFNMNSQCSQKTREKAKDLKAKDKNYEPLFYGRCQNQDSPPAPSPSKKYSVSWDNKPFCLSNNEHYEKLPDRPDRPKDPNCENCTILAGVMKNVTGFQANSDIGQRIVSYRRGHGAFMILAAILGAPISHFVAHFYKETFLRSRLVNLHVWYSVHINFAIMTFLALVAAQVAGVAATRFLGYSRSLAGKLHVVLGWMSIAVYVIVLALSGLRMQAPTSRLLTIFLHYLGGKIFSILNLAAIILSCFIPGSPSARNDAHLSGSRFELFLAPLVFWVIFDLFITIVMNKFRYLEKRVCLQSSDKQMKFRRKRRWALFPWFGVPIPELRPNSNRDLHGASCRKIILFIYSGTAILVTIALLFLLMTSPTKDRYFGKMTVTHNPDGNFDFQVEAYDDAN